jgi:hypothetical protein
MHPAFRTTPTVAENADARRTLSLDQSGNGPMDKTTLIEHRRKKHLSILANDFERHIQPRVPNDVAQKFKALMRGTLKTLGDEAAVIAELDRNVELNDHAQALRDLFEPLRT